MNDKYLKKLNRRQLLEILLEQTKRIEELENELQKTKEKLKEKNVKINNVGSLAEASLLLSDIFKAADEAIAIQVQNIENMAKEEEKRIKKELREYKKKEKEKINKKKEKEEQPKSKKSVTEEKETKEANKTNSVKRKRR